MTVKADGGECNHQWKFRKIHEDVNNTDSSTIENKIYAYCNYNGCIYHGNDNDPDETVKNSYNLWMKITAHDVKYTGNPVSLEQLVDINESSEWQRANIVAPNEYFTAS